ncbi:MAG TPA: aryl-sulfate sulfotransferase N-terminal domain-containing protein [Rhodothermales bacterium]|nr:aryl-sulfate sulfotransferase N-terminal domain-containing protein [Rhodothermales bacterium]
MRCKAIILLTALLFAACDTTNTFEIPEGEIPISQLLADSTTMADGLVLNPSGLTPLAAELSLETRRPTTISIEVSGAEPMVKAFDDVTTAHTFPILGLYADTERSLFE